MAQNTAQYEGLQYSSKAPVFDYGSITRGVNEIVEKKRLEDEAKAKELEAQKSELIKEYGDEIYSTFELTGLENADQLGLETKNLIIDTAEDIQRRLTNGEITQSEATREMMMARNQSKKVSEYVSGLSQYANQLTEQGENISPADELKLNRINSMIGTGVSVGKDSRGNLLFLSKEDGKMVPSPFAKLPSYMTFSQNIQPEKFVDDVMKNSALNTYNVGGVQIQSPFTRDNKITENQAKAFKDTVDNLDGEVLYNAAVNAGIENIDYVLDGELKIKDEKTVKQQLVEKLKEKAMSKYGNQIKDEMKGAEARRADERLAIQRQAATPKVDKTPKFTDTGDSIIYPVSVGNQEKVPAINLGGKPYRDVIITSYKKSKTGGPDEVTISYTGATEGLTEGQAFFNDDKGTAQTATIQIKDPTEVAFVRNALNLNTGLEDLPSGSAADGDLIFQ